MEFRSPHVCMHFMKSIFILFLTLDSYYALEFPNHVIGSPVVDCQQDTITFSIETENGVASHIFAKSHADDTVCSVSNQNKMTFSLADCGMNRNRQLEPKGMMYSMTIVVQLHPYFVTKVDRAYNVQCFYMEVDKVVSSGLDVSMLTTLAFESAHVMPQCTYSLHAGSPQGPYVRFARVGDRVFHVWTCPSDVYGMLVHSCTVKDGRDNSISIVDQSGCSVDDVIMGTPQYRPDLNMVFQETHVFKFADRVNVLFNCQIKLCMKSAGSCSGITPPNCAGGRSTSVVTLDGSTTGYRSPPSTGYAANNDITNPASNPATNPASNPSTNPATNPASNPASNPSTNPATNPPNPGYSTQTLAGTPSVTDLRSQSLLLSRDRPPSSARSSTRAQPDTPPPTATSLQTRTGVLHVESPYPSTWRPSPLPVTATTVMMYNITEEETAQREDTSTRDVQLADMYETTRPISVEDVLLVENTDGGPEGVLDNQLFRNQLALLENKQNKPEDSRPDISLEDLRSRREIADLKDIEVDVNQEMVVLEELTGSEPEHGNDGFSAPFESLFQPNVVVSSGICIPMDLMITFVILSSALLVALIVLLVCTKCRSVRSPSVMQSDFILKR